jgi:hypothetical protein
VSVKRARQSGIKLIPGLVPQHVPVGWRGEEDEWGKRGGRMTRTYNICDTNSEYVQIGQHSWKDGQS